MKDYLVKAEAYDKSVRIYVAHTTHLVERARKIHDTWPLVSAAFGRTLTVSLILGALYKDDQTITVRINGGGPIDDIVTKANTKGEVKGYVGNPHVHLESNNGHLAVGAGVGTNGFIYVTKDLGLKNRYVSSSPLQTGEIGEDFSYYFATSEQIPSAVGLGVLVNPDNKIAASGGFVVQVMPGVKEETINKIEEIVKNMPHISTLIKNNKTPEDIVIEGLSRKILSLCPA